MSTASQGWRPWLEQLRSAWRGSVLPGFFRWWGNQLHELLPRRWRGWFGSGADWYVLEHDAAQWHLRHDNDEQRLASWPDATDPAGQTGRVAPAVLTRALRQVDREDLRLALLLPPELVLRRTLVLPMAARDNLQQVAGFELDRQTPFTLAQVHHAVRELATPAASGRFHAELVVVTRDTLAPLLAQLRDQGIAIDAVDMALASGRLGVNLLPSEQRPPRRRPRRRLNLILAVACAVLLVLVMGEWLHNQRVAVTQMQTEVDAMRGQARQVATLRQQLQDNAGAAGFLAQRKKNTVSMLGLLADVTTRLPDSAWLERFSVDNTGQVGFQGQSPQAAKLLDALKDSSLITDASFQGSIQPDATSGKERFYLVARVQSGTSPASPAAAAEATP